MQKHLNVIGVMTGNSLDGVDLVLTRFDIDGVITDIFNHSKPSPPELTKALRTRREIVNQEHGDMHRVSARLSTPTKEFPSFTAIEAAYTDFVGSAVLELIESAKTVTNEGVDLIGSHGQTCAHFPPSIAEKSSKAPYTVQIGDAQTLADHVGVPVVSDFRSDDLMNGGEGAPLAPLHHKHIASGIKSKGHFPIAFCNGGNTGNITVITQSTDSKSDIVIGFDVGPFNHFPDLLMRTEKDLPYDLNGAFGTKGKVLLPLLKELFDSSAVTESGGNFVTSPYPKSSDPRWYREVPLLRSSDSFEDRLRTAEYFSAYCFMYSLALVDQKISLPKRFALCGGGWKNPVVREHFAALLSGDTVVSPVLPEHRELFDSVRQSLQTDLIIEDSQYFGFDGQSMEARIFADAAFSRVTGRPFTLPETTRAASPTHCGVFSFPNRDRSSISERLLDLLGDREVPVSSNGVERKWSRASNGWDI